MADRPVLEYDCQATVPPPLSRMDCTQPRLKVEISELTRMIRSLMRAPMAVIE